MDRVKSKMPHELVMLIVQIQDYRIFTSFILHFDHFYTVNTSFFRTRGWYNYIYTYFFNLTFLAALGLHCCVWAFSSWGEWGLLFVAVRGLLIAVASLVAEHGL